MQALRKQFALMYPDQQPDYSPVVTILLSSRSIRDPFQGSNQGQLKLMLTRTGQKGKISLVFKLVQCHSVQITFFSRFLRERKMGKHQGIHDRVALCSSHLLCFLQMGCLAAQLGGPGAASAAPSALQLNFWYVCWLSSRNSTRSTKCCTA